MTDVELAVEGVKLSLAAGLLLLVYVGPFRAARVANWRQDLFAVRNALWDRMRECGMLDHPAHRRTRELLNDLIRYAPTLNLFYMTAVILWVPAQPRRAGERDLVDLVREVKDPAAAAAIDAALDRVTTLVLRQLFLYSFPGILIGVPALLALRVFRAAAWMAKAHAFSRSQARWFTDWFASLATPVPRHLDAKRFAGC